jgi:hypothetical protein
MPEGVQLPGHFDPGSQAPQPGGLPGRLADEAPR